MPVIFFLLPVWLLPNNVITQRRWRWWGWWRCSSVITHMLWIIPFLPRLPALLPIVVAPLPWRHCLLRKPKKSVRNLSRKRSACAKQKWFVKIVNTIKTICVCKTKMSKSDRIILIFVSKDWSVNKIEQKWQNKTHAAKTFSPAGAGKNATCLSIAAGTGGATV